MKTIVLFGAGKSATVLIDYLKNLAEENFCEVIIADNNIEIIKEKIGESFAVKAFQLNIFNQNDRQNLIQKADVIISLMPPSLHYLIALDCVEYSKHLLTASYVSDEIKTLQKQVEEKQILFLCEMGLDPGIDHMSAMQIINSIKNKGGKITSFKSHCGGLVAPESDDNPWHYKISWNPRNVVTAGKAGAEYKMNGNKIEKSYEELFTNNEVVEIPNLGMLAFYPNRDSLSYIPLYNLQEADTFVRTTLRYSEFCFGWKNIIDLKLTDEVKTYEASGISIAEFFKIHLGKNNLKSRYEKINENDFEKKQLQFLGLDDNETLISIGLYSAADVLQFILEKKLMLKKDDKDMVVMMHEIEYEKDNIKYEIKSSLIVKGEDNLRTAMAKTVGLPLGIAAKLLLENKIAKKGLHIPVISEIYEPVLAEMEQYNIVFSEENFMYEK